MSHHILRKRPNNMLNLMRVRIVGACRIEDKRGSRVPCLELRTFSGYPYRHALRAKRERRSVLRAFKVRKVEDIGWDSARFECKGRGRGRSIVRFFGR